MTCSLRFLLSTSALSVALLSGQEAADVDVADAPTWSSHIAALVHGSCTPCHRPGQPAPFDLVDFEDVRKRADFVLDVVEQGYMPPWQPHEGEFVGDRRLRPEQVQLLRRWVIAGAPRGDAEHEPDPPAEWTGEAATGWRLGEPDLIVRMADPFDVPAEGEDLVRNFVLPVETDRMRYVEAVEIRPASRAVHHAVLGVDVTRQSRLQAEGEPGPGFGGMTLGAAVPPDGHFLGWTPGKSVRRNPPGFAWRLHPGSDLVLQLHAVPIGRRESVQVEIGFWFTDVPTSQTFDLVTLFSEDIDIGPGDDGFVVTDHVTLPVATTLHAIYPHAHYVCRDMRAVATLPDGTERPLFAIDDWDFDWQDDYRYRTPMSLPAGTRIAMRYVFDNSEHNPNNPLRPLRRVTFGQRSEDEMATLGLSLTLADEEARARLQLAVVDRELEKLPEAWNLLMRKARLERQRGRLQLARDLLGKAVRISPASPDLYYELGQLAEQRGVPAEAAAAYAEALRLQPEHALAHMALGTMHGRAGRGDRALSHFAAAVEALPNSPEAHNNFATANFAAADAEPAQLAIAERHYRRALDLRPDYFNARFNLGRLLLVAGRDARPASSCSAPPSCGRSSQPCSSCCSNSATDRRRRASRTRDRAVAPLARRAPVRAIRSAVLGADPCVFAPPCNECRRDVIIAARGCAR